MLGGVCGGMNPSEKEANAEVQAVCDQVRADIEEKLGKKLEVFEAKKYTTQVVAGTNYFVKIHIGNDVCAHARIYVNLQKEHTLHSVQADKTHGDAIEYF